jgi:hypothetical protein
MPNATITLTLAFCSYTGEFLGLVYSNVNGIAFIRNPHDGAVTARAHAALYRSHRIKIA